MALAVNSTGTTANINLNVNYSATTTPATTNTTSTNPGSSVDAYSSNPLLATSDYNMRAAGFLVSNILGGVQVIE